MSLFKSRGVFASLCWWSILFLSVNAKTKREDETRSMNDVYRGRCASRCLSLHSTRIATLSKQSQVENNGSLGWCQNHRQCAKCLEPCKASWDLKSQCRELCERSIPKKHWECVTSCEFLRSVVAVKQGDCPAPEKASGFAAACVEGCEEDRECSAQKKCCSNGCGHTCQPPKNLNKGAPLKPRKELSFEELRSGQMEVSWSSRFNVSAEPVIYVVQRRWNYGIQPSEDAATQWEVVAQTTEEKARLADIRAGRWYQFRVAAVNVHGTRGFTTPSRHIHTKKDPSGPPAPSELRVSNVTFGPGGRAVSVRLRWSIPSDLDVPVHHYKVSWSWATGSTGATAPPKTKRRKMVNGGQSYVDLESLRAKRSYSVELQAVSYWGQTPLKSPKATLHFNTQHREEQRSGARPVPISEGLIPDVLDVGTPFYQDGQLQVRVYWQRSTDPTVVRYRVQWVPEYCGHNQTKGVDNIITQEGFASLPGLLFSCKYRVNLQPLGTKGRAQAETTFFFTPSCASIRAKSPKHIACPGQEGTPPPKVLSKAENLTASFMAHKGNVTAVFTWEVSAPLPPRQLHGFQVTWAEVTSASRHNNPPNSLISQSQILPPERNVLVVSGLQLATLYRLEIQVIGAGGEGPATTKTFCTPDISPVLQHRPRLRNHHQHQPNIEALRDQLTRADQTAQN
ncbi:anosmin-1-like [Oncorhynchus nerka]|uniref:anosmin-1-like n=1 Tax=Oncorhynchus nerka TaxID=8023 RepID=UPI001130D368|nr:anosmin-1-like isoform X1 [Oncorhynchus nerka]XP_029523018.1 anosmin-1-like isoform X2 [Oncorhynchus nerka]